MGACSTGYLEAFFWSQQYKVVTGSSNGTPGTVPGYYRCTCVYHSSTRSTKCTSKYMYKVYHRNIDTTTCSIKSLGTHSYIFNYTCCIEKKPFSKRTHSTFLLLQHYSCHCQLANKPLCSCPFPFLLLPKEDQLHYIFCPLISLWMQ